MLDGQEKDIEFLIGNCNFFQNKRITIKPFFNEGRIEKSFLVRTIETGENYKVRIGHHKFSNNILNEYRAIMYLKNKGIMWVPEVYYKTSDVDRSFIIVYEYFEGNSLNNFKSLTNRQLLFIKKKLIEQITDLHSIHQKYFGDFVGEKHYSWYEYFRIKLFYHAENAKKIGILSTYEYEQLKRIFSNTKKDFVNITSQLLHFDINPKNIIYNDENQSVRLIDLELCRFGDVHMEFSKFLTFTSIRNLKKESANISTEIDLKLFLPLVQHFLSCDSNDYIQTKRFLIYHIHNLLASYCSSYLKHGIKRNYMIDPLKFALNKLTVQQYL